MRGRGNTILKWKNKGLVSVYVGGHIVSNIYGVQRVEGTRGKVYLSGNDGLIATIYNVNRVE